jgi:hypothetical protein
VIGASLGINAQLIAEATMMLASTRIAIATIAIGGFFALACGSDKPKPTASSEPTEGGEQVAAGPHVYKRGSGSIAAAIGPGGGTLELASGPRVEIPPGTLESTEDVVLKEAPLTTAFSNQEHERPEGPTFVIGPPLEAPANSKIRISIPLAAYPEGWGEVALGHEYPIEKMVGSDDAEHTRWQYETARLVDGRAQSDVQVVNGYRLQFILSNLDAQ